MSVLGAVGAVVGGYFGGPAGAQAGYALGSAVETAGKTIKAPKPGDLSVSTSSYGYSLPECFGPMRVAASVLWSAPLIVRVETDGGKGGPAVETNKYFWSAVLSFGWADPRSAPSGYEIRRVWINKKLVVDLVNVIGSGSSVASDFEAALASKDFFKYCEWHGGGASQMPPTIQQEFDGVDQTPGYAFHARLDIRDLPLTDDVGFGELQSRPPVIECEIAPIDPRAIAPHLEQIFSTPSGQAIWPEIDVDRGADQAHWVGVADYNGGPVTIVEKSGADGEISRSMIWHDMARGVNGPINFPAIRRQVETLSGVKNFWDMYIGTADPLRIAYTYGSGTPPLLACDYRNRVLLGYYSSPDVAIYVGGGMQYEAAIIGGVEVLLYHPTITDTLPAHVGIGAARGVAMDQYCAYVLYQRAPDNAMCVRRYPLPVVGYLAPPAAYADQVDLVGPTSGLYINGGSANCAIYADARGVVWVLDQKSSGGLALYRCAAAAGARDFEHVCDLTGGLGSGGGVMSGDASTKRLFCDGRILVIAGYDGIYAATLTAAGDAGVTVGAVVRAMCRRSDLTLMDIDTADIDDAPIHGYGIGARIAARPVIEQLQLHTPMTPVESGGLMRFRADGKDDVVHVIAPDELVELVSVQRAQDSELPREVSIQYMSTDAAYQPGAQSARMLTASGTEQTSMPVGISMDDTTAARAAARALASAYVQRESYAFATTLAMAEYEPGDVVQVTSEGRTYTMRLVSREEGQGQIKWSGKAFSALVYDQYAVATPLDYVQQEIGLAGSSRLIQLAGLPPLRDSDTGPGIYIAYDGYGAGWHGARLQRSGLDIPGTASPYRAKVGLLRGPITARPDTLPDFVNSVDIAFDASRNVELANIEIADCLQGLQIVAIDDELIGITRAALIAPGVYRCTGLLRGLRGSKISAHTINTRAVVVDAVSVLRYAYEPYTIGSPDKVRAVSNGQDPTKARDVSITRTAGTSQMLSPCAIAGGRLPGGDIQIQWQRRARFDQALRSNGAPALDDQAEMYEIEIVRGSVRRSVTVSAPAFVYTSAMQAADGGATTSITVHVSQMSSVSGKGRTAIETLYIPA